MGKYADFVWAEVGQRIRARRLAQGKTQVQLASAAGITQNGIFRLEAGNSNPQLSTLQSVAKALDASVRELVCGVAEADTRLNERFDLVRKILESGDPAAVRAMDHGLENAQVLLERTAGIRQQMPAHHKSKGMIRLRRPMTPDIEALLGEPPKRRTAGSRVFAEPKLGKGLATREEELFQMIEYRLNDAPPLPVGSAGMLVVPNSNRSKVHHDNSDQPKAQSRSPHPKQ